jgi:very-short-patch-repair endonuclease
MTIQQYITKIDTLYKTGNAREHSYRGDLQNLIMAILPDVLVTNEPARVACGAPDYVLTRKEVPIGYIEAKDIGQDLGHKSLKEQFDRYKAGLTNLIFTDYLDFHFYKEGAFVTKIAIATIENGTIKPLPENFDQFTNLIINFAQTISQTIKSPTKLAQMMAGKAKLMADVIEKSLNNDDLQGIRSSIKSQMLSFQHMLIHDIDNKAFADIYAQTIAYGMFAARYHDPTLPTFSREEAATLIPKSNPFLRKLFQDIAGYDLDHRLVWIVEELVSIFLASDVAMIMKNFGKSTKQEDPVVHFYETFLGEYNPALRKARGVWYTPQPVVNFIVRAVDDILKTEFGLKEGLADTSKIKIKKNAVTQTGIGANSKIKEVETEVEVHKVQILDPATGTGTFLAEVVKHIHKKFEGQQGIWSQYVTNDLIPRLNGFELLMASYAMAHLKMDMLLTETGYKPTTPPDGHPSKGGESQRIKIFLTNSLEEAHPDTQTLFSSWLSDEADQANAIKRDAPVMVVMGNPPYSISSSNKSEWIQNLIKDYKKDLNERKINIDDDYIKFTRFGQHFIDKNGSGILAYISNNSFIDGITHRQMRKHLLQSFDKIYIINLHGDAKKKEVSPDGSVDQNVFDIMAGVSINIFIKTDKKQSKDLSKIFYYDLFGKRNIKYDELNNNSVDSFDWIELKYEEPYYFFVPKDFNLITEYENGFILNSLFKNYNSGIQTKNDKISIHFNKNEIENVVTDFTYLNENELIEKYQLKIDGVWNVKDAKKDILIKEYIFSPILYRPFDIRQTILTNKSGGFIGRPRYDVMKHVANKKNVSIIVNKQFIGDNFNHIGVTNIINCHGTFYLGNKGQDYIMPLYIYPETTTQQSLLEEVVRTPNLNMEIVNKMANDLGMFFSPEKPDYNKQTAEADMLCPIDILDYIYAVLHSPSYREKYKEFLKIDFPRVPYPKNQRQFIDLVDLGSQLRQIHLLESEVVDKLITQYPEDGDNVVVKPRYENSPPLEGCPQGGVVQDINIKSSPIYFNPKLDLPCNIKLKPRAKELRQAENLSEVLFWMQVTKGQFYNIDFDRQRIIGNYIVDFYVKKLGLIIEIDGSSHDNKEKYDAERDAYFESLGLKVYHIPVVEVLQQMKLVMQKLEEFIINNYNSPPHPAGTPPKEGNVGRVYINETQYFANVPEVAWNFYIGGYQPAQKWLKDRKDRELSYEDILHYQKIIVALKETDRLMKEIDKIEL